MGRKVKRWKWKAQRVELVLENGAQARARQQGCGHKNGDELGSTRSIWRRSWKLVCVKVSQTSSRCRRRITIGRFCHANSLGSLCSQEFAAKILFSNRLRRSDNQKPFMSPLSLSIQIQRAVGTGLCLLWETVCKSFAKSIRHGGYGNTCKVLKRASKFGKPCRDNKAKLAPPNFTAYLKQGSLAPFAYGAAIPFPISAAHVTYGIWLLIVRVDPTQPLCPNISTWGWFFSPYCLGCLGRNSLEQRKNFFQSRNSLLFTDVCYPIWNLGTTSTPCAP